MHWFLKPVNAILKKIPNGHMGKQIAKTKKTKNIMKIS